VKTHRPLKLCYISNPNSIHTRRWLNWFVQQGHNVTLLADAPVHVDYPGVTVIDMAKRFNTRVVRFIYWAFWVRRLVHQLHPDILHAHRVNSAGWLGAFAGYHPLVVTPWGSDLLTHPDRSWVARLLAQYVLHRADLLTVNSSPLNDKAISYGAKPEKIYHIQWGVELDIFHPGLDTSGLRRQLKVGNVPLVLSLRAIKPLYNIGTIIDALPAVLSRYPDASVILLNFNTDINYRKELERKIQAHNLSEHMRWAGPFDERLDFARLVCLADVIVSVPSSDSTPSSLLEAMACGAPIIASDLPSIREWITPGVNGLLVPPKDGNALAGAIINLLDSPELLTSFSQINRHLVMDRANQQEEMAKMEKLYYGLIHK
jgi:L-malate glycosyltransferase